MVPMSNLQWCYQVLELKPGASLEEVNQAYKDLVFIWHPDRIPKDNPRLLQKAQEKLKDLNYARDHLRAHCANNPSQNGHTSRRSHPYKPYPRPHDFYQSSNYQSSNYQSSNHNRQATNYQSSNHQSSNSQSPNYQSSNYQSSNYQSSNHQPSNPQAANHQSSSSQSSNRQSSTYQPSSQSHRSSYSSHQTEPIRNPYYQTYAQAQTQTHYEKPPDFQAKSVHASPSQRASQHPDLSGADLSSANLAEKDLSGRNLSGANLSNANLSDAFLHHVNLSGANLQRANLFRANLLQANLRQANLRDCNLIGADLSGADLSGADLSGAQIGYPNRVMVKLTGAILSGTIMPDGTVHE